MPAVPGFLNGQAVPPGVGEFVVQGRQVPLPHRGEDLQARILGGDGGFHADLIVALAGGAMGDTGAALLLGGADQFAPNQVTGQGGTQEATRLVNRVGLQQGESEIAQELFPAVDDLSRGGTQFERHFAERLQINFLTEIDGERQHLIAALMHQPVEGQARFEITVERENGTRQHHAPNG